jgi:hypothetical protein
VLRPCSVRVLYPGTGYSTMYCRLTCSAGRLKAQRRGAFFMNNPSSWEFWSSGVWFEFWRVGFCSVQCHMVAPNPSCCAVDFRPRYNSPPPPCCCFYSTYRAIFSVARACPAINFAVFAVRWALPVLRAAAGLVGSVAVRFMSNIEV